MAELASAVVDSVRPLRTVLLGLLVGSLLGGSVGAQSTVAQSTAPQSLGNVEASPLELASAPKARSISIDEIERGQKGYGLSVFAGSERERFGIEVIGVLRDLNPGMSFILARLSGQGLEQSGVVAGMSGSPVYIDDRLAGAVAFSWNFASEPIAGITPIDDMRQLLRLPSGTAIDRTARSGSGDGSAAGNLGSVQTLRSLLDPAPRHDLLEQELRAMMPASGLGHRPGALLSVGGFTGRAQELLTTALAPLGAVAPAGKAAEDAISLPPLESGSAVAGVLVGGDLQVAVSGTVTERNGAKVLAFGHPFLGFGALRIPMAQAEVVTVVPSRFSSFKLTNVGPVIGAFDQDRLSGLRGEIGLLAPTTPVEIRIRGAADRDYHLEVADIAAMRPSLVAVSALQALEAASRSAGDQGVDLSMRFDLAGYSPLELRQSFDGPGAGVDAAIYLLQLVGFLELNTWVDVVIDSIDLELFQSERPRTATVLGVVPSRRQVRSGDEIDLYFDLRDFRGERFAHTESVTIPAGLAKGPYYLFVGDGMSVDAARLQLEPLAPKDFAQSLELLASYHSRDDLVILGARGPARGVVVSGRSLPSLPSSMRSIYAAGDRQAKALSLEIVQETVSRFDRPLDGLARVDLEVLAPQSQSSPANSPSSQRQTPAGGDR